MIYIYIFKMCACIYIYIYIYSYSNAVTEPSRALDHYSIDEPIKNSLKVIEMITILTV